ncbi:MAG: N-acetyltransferase [Chloroflexi bacterium]|nr:MAG: N-acetyltransferase [Chloroflexota bacterium]
MLTVQPVTLPGRIVRLAPLELNHVPDLAAAGNDESIWKYMRYGAVTTEPEMRRFVTNLLAMQARGTDLPFAVIHLDSQRAVGMTRYMNIEPANHALEIGGTWYSPAFQRTGVNTECKFLLLQHAFEGLDCVRVQIKTDLRNERSQRAIERIGAIREGVLRDHMVLPDGTLRSSVFYSVLAREWSEVKQRLLNLMNHS